ncbi:MAG: DNA primase [Bacteroidia bacterium]|nr:DNA primase [Bacteroidia bacterium]MCX7652832.1 DNA primase [Bacteroidia bacterium]MDW8415940.1 DNA primase [Bacteroidia bacterium]
MSWLREEVLRRADIVEVVNEYVPLKKKGANYWALSPFKPEKTPSFAVSPSKQIFKCFASGKGGDVIRFVMEMEGLSYGEALRKLAQKYNISLPEDTDRSPSQTRERQRYLAIYQEALRFYREKLRDSPAIAYLERRGIKPQAIETFQLGYAPPDGAALTQYLLQLGYPEKVLLEWGLSLRSEGTGRLYDRFRGRLIFPIHDEQGAVIAFAGRTIEQDEPKYLNSPDTPFYRKSDILYGLYQARSVLRKDMPALIVEGYLDVISLHQAGFAQAVATCGTALTEAHLDRLRRYTKRLMLMYDNDSAGEAATLRAIAIGLNAGFFVSVAAIEGAKDPDELLQSQGASAIHEALDSQLSWVKYLTAKQPTDTPEKRYQLIQQIGENLRAIPDPLLQRVYAEEVEDALRIPIGFWENFDRAELSARKDSVLPRAQRITAEKELLRIALTYPTHLYAEMPIWEFLREEFRHLVFSDENAERLRRILCEWVAPAPPTVSELVQDMSPEMQDWLTELLMEKHTLSPHWRMWDDSPMEEEPVAVLESNLALLHLNHIQRLLIENLNILSSLSPDNPTYEEHLSIHQVLIRQRAALAQQWGILLPYQTHHYNPEEK